MRLLSALSCWASLLLQLLPTEAFPTQGFMASQVNGTRGAVASESSVCSHVGADIIGIGGSAADAMVATTLCIGVIGMYHSGIGGGGFMLVRDEKGNHVVIDSRETAPAASDQDMYNGKPNASTTGGLSMAVPGELRGLEYLHKTYGKLDWATLVQPAAYIARQGFAVTEDLLRYMDSVGGNNSFLVVDPAWAMIFAPNGMLVKLGDNVVRRHYAETLDEIAARGPSAFYEGRIAASIIDSVNKTGGIMTFDDLRKYRANVKNALSIDYRGYRLYSTDAPSSGAVMLSILNTMNQYDAEDIKDRNLTSHRFVEAMKFAYGARQELGDPDFVSNIRDYEAQMLSKEKAQQIKARILDNMTQPITAYDPLSIYTTDSQGTSHIVTSDSSGMTVSYTTTVNLLFGSRIMTPDTGIILNNEMDDFSQPGQRNSFGFEPSPANFIAPGKRPLSSICPVIVEFASNGSIYFTTGAAGGSRIISATAQTVFNVLEAGFNMHDAVARPRLHDQLMPATTLVEVGTDEAIFESLAQKGHNATWQAPGQSAVQAIMRLWNGTFDAVGETRQINSGGAIV